MNDKVLEFGAGILMTAGAALLLVFRRAIERWALGPAPAAAAPPPAPSVTPTMADLQRAVEQDERTFRLTLLRMLEAEQERGNQLEADLKALKESLAQVQASLSQAISERDAERARATELQAQLETERARAAELQAQLDATNRRIQDLEVEVRDLRAQIGGDHAGLPPA